ncbi:hypothetical protein [Actinoplanes regularis]|uniref:PknH-like extracellular domain-containing protein n=1 Tax=Actinoplanes regularis TaxID=52697 RepID=A0A239FKI7_9ACTN|nr:hypothetical protein [Actinoplanes regularis]GIE89642.1 hypothetical protein Are01nite_61220 [Actinoplanes regularis]SNS57267.1 hypothetical protein SAMN06264365_118123 [Actinoplanes regularis]
MGIRKIRTIKLATAIPVALVATLAVNLSPAVAAPAAEADVKPARLKSALLTVDQLPAGSQPVPLDKGNMSVTSLMASQYDPADTRHDPCAPMRQVPTTPPATTPPPAAPESKSLTTRKALSTADIAALLSPRDGKATAEGRGAPIEIAAFVTGETGPIVVESLADLGRVGSRSEVHRIERILLRCPALHRGQLRLTMTPLWMPQLGDQSVAMDFTLTYIIEGKTPKSFSLYGKSVLVAYKNVSMNLVTVGFQRDDIETAKLRALAKTAMHNLRKANW